MTEHSETVSFGKNWKNKVYKFFARKSIVKKFIHGLHIVIGVLLTIFLCLSFISRVNEVPDGAHRLNGKFSQDAPEFVGYIRENIRQIIEFPDPTKTETTEKVYYDSENSEAAVRSRIFKNLVWDYLISSEKNKIGFFVEIGTGEGLSSFRDLETDYQWKGLIIEPNKTAYRNIRNSNLQALTGNFCVSPKRHYTAVIKINHDRKEEKIDCYPLYTIISALKLNMVDFMSIITGGTEFDIIKTLPKNSFVINIIYIDYRYIKNGQSEVLRLMKDRDYHLIDELKHQGKAVGSIFAHDYLRKGSYSEHIVPILNKLK